MIVNKSKQKQIFFYVSVLLLIAAIVPLFIIAHYNFTSFDDYAFSSASIDDWLQNHSLFRVLKLQLEFAKYFYYAWQGTVSMTWIGGSVISMIREEHYFLSTYITLGGFILSELVLFMLIGFKALESDIYDAGIVSCWLIIFQVLMVPYPVEAFYWACGSIMYVTGYNAAVLLYALFFLYIHRSLREERAQNRTYRLKGLFLQLGIIVLSVYIAFGNYVSALFCFSSLLLLVFGVWFKKVRGRIVITVDFIIYTVIFVLNMTAPGNKIRKGASGTGDINPVKALLKSLYEAASYIICNIYPTVIIIMIMMLPFVIGLVKKRAFGSQRPFRRPLVFSIITYGLYASQFVPNMYALGFIGAGRVVNLYRLSLYLFYFSNLIYWTGWGLRRIHEELPDMTSDILAPKKSYLLVFETLCIALLCFSAIFYGGTTLTTVSAIKSLSTGQAYIYRREYEERLVVLKDESVKDAVFEEFTDPPYLLFFGDIKEDPGAWENRDVASFYGKESVRIVEE